VSGDTQIIFVGDQGQLGPVNAKAGWSAMNNPHYTLRTIMRQVADSAIITLAHAVRHDTLEQWDAEDTGEVSFKDKAKINWQGFDLKDSIVLVPTDKRRRMFNFQARRDLERPDGLCIGDFIVSHHNNPFLGINNGATAEVLKVETPDDYEYRAQVRLIGSSLRPFWTSILREELDGDMREASNSRSRKGHWVYAYAMTVHKAQGSEWDNVLVAGEQYWGSDAEKRCWRYTAYTRARSRLVIAP
jgi:exodeoxyribonuclease-5